MEDIRIVNLLSDLSFLGKGSFGKVWAGVLDGKKKIAIKETELTRGEKTRFYNQSPFISTEYRFNLLTNDLVDKGICQNYVMAFDISFYKTVNGSIWSSTVMELADGELDSLETEREWMSVIYQTLLALHCIQKYYGIVHRDIKRQNVLVKRGPPGGYFDFDGDFRVVNYGTTVLLSDFGVAESLHPDYTMTNNYGSRDARVVDGKFIPLPSSRLKWDVPSVAADIDYRDMMQYPPSEFFIDVQDTLGMFLGNKKRKINHCGTHSPMQTPDSILKRLKWSGSPLKKSTRRAESVHEFLAVEMVKKIHKAETASHPAVDNVSPTLLMNVPI